MPPHWPFPQPPFNGNTRLFCVVFSFLVIASPPKFEKVLTQARLNFWFLSFSRPSPTVVQGTFQRPVGAPHPSNTYEDSK